MPSKTQKLLIRPGFEPGVTFFDAAKVYRPYANFMKPDL
jgi:aryl-alcohol dehydrogenase-like predicted oxidoreductase